ncbi:MAG: hypothetical protein OXN25_08845 [Candidatus Poribacteria bacterium]|nr:hypothetical protein [Candidatus Poribacteria bacterium]
MKFSIDWNLVTLRENPFMVNPPTDPKRAIWAGMDELKDEFKSVFWEAKASAPTQVVLCRGPIGGGKTHASLFFSSDKNIPDASPSIQSIEVLRVQTPTETGNPARDFYLDVIEQIGLERIGEAVKKNVGSVGRNVVERNLRQTMVSSDFVNALLKLYEASPISPGAGSPLSAYFLGKCTTTELRKLGLNRNIEKTQDYFRVLAGVFRCLTGLSESADVTQHNRFCLWIDEMENFIYFTPPQYRPFGQGLRELVDRLPYFFTLFMNFTLTSPEEYEEIELILGGYLTDRITGQIFFHEVKDQEKMLQYVRELLSHYRIEEKPKTPYFPFTEEALRALMSNLQRGTPRDMNKRCRNALMRAFERRIFQDGKDSEITLKFVQEMSQEELDKEIG